MIEVEIPKVTNHEGFSENLIKVKISDKCPICGKRRAVEKWKGPSFDGSRILVVDCWRNECEHIDKYEDVLLEHQAAMMEEGK